MAMQRQTWSISALSIELKTDRRTMAKRLDGLEPAEIKSIGKRTEKRYYMDDVIKYLNRSKNSDNADAKIERLIEQHKQFCTKFLFPSISNSSDFIGTIIGGVTEDMGLSKEDALKIYDYTLIGLMGGMNDFFDTTDLNFELTGFAEKMIYDKQKRSEFIKEDWLY